jgi:predicted nucleotidyltransferase
MVTKIKSTAKQVDKQVNALIKLMMPFKPDKVILFGSYAFGGMHRDSDIDLLIVKKTKDAPSKRAYQVRKCLNSIDMAFDILVFTPQEIKHRLAVHDFFIKDILERGKVIYEKRKF